MGKPQCPLRHYSQSRSAMTLWLLLWLLWLPWGLEQAVVELLAAATGSEERVAG